MLLEGLNFVPEETEFIGDRKHYYREVDLQDTNAVMTELVRTLVYHNFQTVDSDATNWELIGELVKVGQQNPYKMHVLHSIVFQRSTIDQMRNKEIIWASNT